jgi:hypothetical protein
MLPTGKKQFLGLALTILLIAALACNMPEFNPTPDEPVPDEPMPDEPPPDDGPPPKPSPWETIAGTWSGCVTSSGTPSQVEACTEARGAFTTLYLLPDCEIGELCGTYVKAAFDSEFLLLKLTLTDIDGPVVLMYAEIEGEMHPDASTDVRIDRQGSNVRIIEVAGYQSGFVLPPGCDPVIEEQTSIGCFEHLP